jgi:alkanesulfonate monooxygenase SsuD/methylene tetrahydromethanopterin reductase-like flavin-dependent oxidoreductase (luciferase family)
VWDHVIYSDSVVALADPWIALAAIAAATTRERIGALVSPLPRYRPAALARALTWLAQLSGGRLVVGAGLGSDNSLELSGFGEELDARVRGDMLDEALAVLAACWSGEPLDHRGEHFVATGKPFLPRPVQRPAPSVWLASRGEAKRPMRRAARYDGWFPIELTDPDALAAGIADITAQRAAAGLTGPFDVAVTDDDLTADPAPWIAAGATWWLTGFGLSPRLVDVEAAIEAGPLVRSALGRRLQLRAGVPAVRTWAAIPAAHDRISVQSRRSLTSSGVLRAIARSTKFDGSFGTRPPKTTCSRTPSCSASAMTLAGSSHSGSGSLTSPTGPEEKTQNGRCSSSRACCLRKRRASRRQRFMYTALPRTTAS